MMCMFSKKLRDTCSVRPVSCSDAVKYAHCRGATHRADSAYFGHVASPNLWLGTEAVTAAQVTHHEQKLRLTFWRFLRNALDASMLPGRDAISHAAGQEAVVPDLEPSRYAGLETPVRTFVAFVLGPALRTLQQSSVRFRLSLGGLSHVGSCSKTERSREMFRSPVGDSNTQKLSKMPVRCHFRRRRAGFFYCNIAILFFLLQVACSRS